LEKRAAYLAYLLNQLLLTVSGRRGFSSKEHLGNRRLTTPGILLKKAFHSAVEKVLQGVEELWQEEWQQDPRELEPEDDLPIINRRSRSQTVAKFKEIFKEMCFADKNAKIITKCLDTFNENNDSDDSDSDDDSYDYISMRKEPKGIFPEMREMADTIIEKSDLLTIFNFHRDDL